jgi:hypothetical protein
VANTGTQRWHAGVCDIRSVAVVYGGMNVAGNADICGNVLLTLGRVRFSRFISGHRRQPTQLGRWWWVSGDKRKHKHDHNVSSCFVGVESRKQSVQATPVYTSASTTDFTSYIKLRRVSTGYEYLT